ncbi:hypothetical protein ACFCYN_25045 [Gottfriedia sp. NPDC056225]|uniref:hypothetical protein n=1 Tax=Gottfriedia sp. NPDC056225 TaxID=3345751 RepID=UPI0035E314BF
MSIFAFILLPAITLLLALSFLVNFKSRSKVSKSIGIILLIFVVFMVIGIATYFNGPTLH